MYVCWPGRQSVKYFFKVRRGSGDVLGNRFFRKILSFKEQIFLEPRVAPLKKIGKLVNVVHQ